MATDLRNGRDVHASGHTGPAPAQGGQHNQGWPPHRPISASSAGDSDELAALFLGEEGASDPACRPSDTPTHHDAAMPGGPHGGGAQHRAPHTEPAVDLIVLGNLPVYAGAWASQYARDRASGGRVVGLLALHEEEASVAVHPAEAANDVQNQSLADAVAMVGRLGGDLLVRLPAAESAWVAAEGDVRRLTVLCGADDPAIVGAYRTLKGIAQDLPNGLEIELAVAIAGSPSEAAAAAGEKLRAAAERFLGLELTIERPLERVDLGRSRQVFTGQAPAWAQTCDLLDRFRAGSLEAAAAHGGPGLTEGAHPAAPTAAQAAAEAPSQADRQDPIPTTGPDSGDGRGSLASMLEGLQPLEVTCPYARGVELATDASGGLHAVALAGGTRDAATGVRDLVVVSSWLRDHTDLLACAIGRPLRAGACERHLVLEDAKGALSLAQGDLRVHVAVMRDGRPVAVCDLN